MKKQFSADEISRIRESWINHSSVTAGPNTFQMMMSVFDGKEIFFWLDDVAKAVAIITGLDIAPDDNGSKTEWVLRGKIRPALTSKYLYSFEMHYNSHMRQGRLENAKGFTQLAELN